jgi:hypothetical protein
MNSDADTDNPTEAIFLSPDADADGDNEVDFNQIELGDWTVEVSAAPGGTSTALRYAVVITGGVTVRGAILLEDVPERELTRGDSAGEPFACDDTVMFKVLDVAEVTDPAVGLTPGEISSRVTIEVLDELATVVDAEAGYAVTQAAPGVLRFDSVYLTLVHDDTAIAGNGVIEVDHGWVLRATYADETNGTPDAAKRKEATSAIVCSVTPGEATDVLATAYDANTGEVSISYTPGCNAADHTIAFGPLADVGTYGYTGQDCNIGVSGAYDSFDPGPDSVFFFVVAHDGRTEGSYGRNSTGFEHPEQTNDPVCPLVQDLGLSPCD